MNKFLCIDDDDTSIIGNSIEEAFKKYKANVSDYVDIEDLTFHELKNPVKARLVLTINEVS
jgi:hypothetical protein